MKRFFMENLVLNTDIKHFEVKSTRFSLLIIVNI